MSIFYRCPICDAERCDHDKFAEPVKLDPCPFCEGPPVPFATSDVHGFKWDHEGSMVDAYVSCHECGARGPVVDELCYSDEDVPDLINKAVLLWQTRNARHRSLHDSGEARGLNLHPRGD